MTNTFWDKYGGLVRTAKKQVVKKEPMTIEEMMQNSIDKQRRVELGSRGSWWKDGKVRVVCGIFKLVDSDKDGIEISKEQFNRFVDDFETEFKKGKFVNELKEVEIKQKKANVKRATGIKSKRKIEVELE